MENLPFYGDAYRPAEIAERVESLGVAKARTDARTLLLLAILAGAYISMGALFFTVVMTESELGLGITRLAGGLAFCLGLVLVVIGGAELFTGNNLLAMAWASGLISTREIIKNWGIVYAGNVIGCLGTVLLAAWGGVGDLGDGALGDTALRIAESKADLSLLQAFSKGILCNALVCLGVWLAMGGHSLADKFLAILLPISAFVAIGLEHSIANWFFLPFGMILDGGNALGLWSVLVNLLAVTAGNLIGGTLLVAGVYWEAYLRPKRA